MGKKARVLFVCYGNACRSAMAEKIVNHFHSEIAAADSAGTHHALPYISMDEATIRVMNEIDIDISRHCPKSVKTISDGFDVIVNMSPIANEELLTVLKSDLRQARMIFWDVPDPRGQSLGTYRAVRDLLREKIRTDLFPNA